MEICWKLQNHFIFESPLQIILMRKGRENVVAVVECLHLPFREEKRSDAGRNQTVTLPFVRKGTKNSIQWIHFHLCLLSPKRVFSF